jgi:hypothetical protein
MAWDDRRQYAFWTGNLSSVGPIVTRHRRDIRRYRSRGRHRFACQVLLDLAHLRQA